MKHISPNMCKRGHEREMLSYRIGVFLPLTGISREEVGTGNVLKLHPHSDHVRDLLLNTTVFENSIVGIPPWFSSLQTVLETGLKPPCSYSGVSWVSSSSGKVLVVTICFGRSLCHVLTSLSESPTCCPSPPESPEKAPTGHVYPSDSVLFFQPPRGFLSVSGFLQFHCWPVLVW